MTREYQAAIEKNNQAIAVFDAVKKSYRAGLIADEVFLAAKKVYDLAMVEFDIAFAKERDRETWTWQITSEHGLFCLSVSGQTAKFYRTYAAALKSLKRFYRRFHTDAVRPISEAREEW